MSILIVHPIAASLVGMAGALPGYRESVRIRPHANSAVNHEPAMKAALAHRFDQLGIDLPERIELISASPTNYQEVTDEILKKDGMRGSHQRISRKGPDGKPDGSDVGSRIKYNRNSDVSILAHEMGHAVGQRTDTGRIINNLRRNPKLTAAIGAAAGLVPLGVAMANEGDDEYTTAALGALALHSPTIIDEALASKNALAMMNTAGIRASLGQRGLLAGALMSYMAAPIATASLGTAIGNQFDEEPAPM